MFDDILFSNVSFLLYTYIGTVYDCDRGDFYSSPHILLYLLCMNQLTVSILPYIIIMFVMRRRRKTNSNIIRTAPRIYRYTQMLLLLLLFCTNRGDCIKMISGYQIKFCIIMLSEYTCMCVCVCTVTIEGERDTMFKRYKVPNLRVSFFFHFREYFSMNYKFTYIIKWVSIM